VLLIDGHVLVVEMFFDDKIRISNHNFSRVVNVCGPTLLLSLETLWESLHLKKREVWNLNNARA